MALAGLGSNRSGFYYLRSAYQRKAQAMVDGAAVRVVHLCLL